MEETTYTGPVTPEEIKEVFGWKLINPEAILIERVAPAENIGSSLLIVPDGVRKKRQTGGTAGTIIQIGKHAATHLEELSGEPVGVGDVVTFGVYAPQPAGLTDKNGNTILPGFSDSRYACVEVVHFNTIIGVVIKS